MTRGSGQSSVSFAAEFCYGGIDFGLVTSGDDKTRASVGKATATAWLAELFRKKDKDGISD